MVRHSRVRFFLLILAILSTAALLASCSPEQIRSPKPNSDWSRGLRVGLAKGLSAPDLIMEPAGTAHITWTAETLQSEGSLGYSQISPSGELITQAVITTPDKHLRGGSIRMAGDDLELCWNSDKGVRCSPLDPEAPDQIQPYTLIPSPPDISSYNTAGDYYVWITIEGDLYFAKQDSAPVKLSSTAINAKINADQGDVIIIWSEAKTEGETVIQIAISNDDGLGSPKQIGRISAGVSSGMRQAGLGAVTVGDEVCGFYDNEFTRGLEGGTAFTEYSCLDAQTLMPAANGRLGLITTDKLEYIPYDGPFAIDRLALLSIPVSNFTYQPSMPVAREDSLSIAVSTPGKTRYKIRQQIAQIVFKDRQILGYQPISDTTGSSLYPTLSLDEKNNFYAVWLERTTVNAVYFATTNPLALDTLDQMDTSEALVTALGIIVESVTGLFILPFALVWVGVGFVGLGAGILITRLVHLNRWSDDVGFIFGVIALWYSKLLFMPQLLTYVPFSSYMPGISPTFSTIWRSIILIMILLGSLFLSTRLTRHWDLPSVVTRFGLYGVIDITLTALFYGAIFQGAA